MQPPPTLLLLLPFFLFLLPPFLRLRRRLYHLRHRHHPYSSFSSPPAPLPPSTSIHLLALLGSGGHTGELLSLLSDTLPLLGGIPSLTYVATDTDTHSLPRARALHTSSSFLRNIPSRFLSVPRAREVGQPALSSLFSSLRSFVALWGLLGRERPAVVLSNGPATGAVAAFVAVGREVLWGERCQIVYVESLARVDTLSLSGKLLYYVADRFLVQWPELQEKYPRAEFYGRLC